jgi:iron complex transport system substrate-binding protein
MLGIFSDWRDAVLFARNTAMSAVFLALGACTATPKADRASRSYGVDNFGDTIRLAKPPQRIVTLAPATTEILFALGAGPRLVGRTQYDLWPDSAKLVPDLGPGIRPNVERVLAVKPDLVLLYASEDDRPAAKRFRDAGIATAAFKVDRIAQFDSLTRLLGRLLGDSTRGALVADSVRHTLDSVRALTAHAARVRVAIPVWDEPLIVIGGGSFMNELIDIAGGENVFASLPAPSPTVTFEELLRRNPDVLLVGPERAGTIRTSARWRSLQAVRGGRVLVIDTAVTLRPATRLGEGAVSLARLLHPELVH